MDMNDITQLVVNVHILHTYEWDREVLEIQNYAKPQVSLLFHFYPEETNRTVSEFWHADQLTELLPELFTLMYCKGFKDFYVNELAELITGKLMIPHLWSSWEGVVCTDAYKVTLMQVRHLLLLAYFKG